MTSASGSAVFPPFGGIAFFPLSALLCNTFIPCAMRGAHAALSPNLGAPAMPGVWQTMHTVSYVALPFPPDAAAEADLGAAAAIAGICGSAIAGAAAGAG